MHNAKTSDVLEEVLLEREAQHAKWGEQNLPDGTSKLFKASADRARRDCDAAFARGDGTWVDVLVEETNEALAEIKPARLRAELIQVAAVAVAWIEAIDRRAKDNR